MATFRTLSPALWSDPFIEGLSAQEKLLYIYLFTNEHVNNVGYMQATLRKISFETAVPQDAVAVFLEKTDRLGKTVRDGDSILCLNFVRHQTTKSPKVVQNLCKVFNLVGSAKLQRALLARYPDVFKNADTVPDPLPEDTDTVPTPYPNCIDTVGKQLQDRVGHGIEKKDPEHTHTESLDLYAPQQAQCACASSPPLNGEDIAERRDAAQAHHQRGDYEFNTLRSEYDRVKREAPFEGRAEFMRLFHSPEWGSSSLDEILAGLDRLASSDRGFVCEERFRPGLAKFLSTRMWTMEARSPDDEGIPTPEQAEQKRRYEEGRKAYEAKMAARRAARS